MSIEKHKLDEHLLVSRAKTDPEAFSELYDIYFPKIFRYVSWRADNKADTEDIVSDVFVKVLDKIETFKWQKDAAFSSWIFRIAHNTLVDYYRTKQKKSHINLDHLPEIESDEILPDESYERKLLFQKLHRLIQELPERQAEIITMRFFAGMKNKEIAEVLEIKEKSVAACLCRGLQTLHDKFNKQ